MDAKTEATLVDALPARRRLRAETVSTCLPCCGWLEGGARTRIQMIINIVQPLQLYCQPQRSAPSPPDSAPSGFQGEGTASAEMNRGYLRDGFAATKVSQRRTTAGSNCAQTPLFSEMKRGHAGPEGNDSQSLMHVEPF